ncbi:MAG TPA: sigma 54-interacting transcriptional regulator [Polyangia bacterium]|nr:sigma 54-interacting transcriptional regulator [Polyangia bacterium]
MIETQQRSIPSTFGASADADGLIYGPGSPLIDIKRACLRIAVSDASTLLTGETGTGKEVFARFIHNHSARKNRQFVPVNCGAIPETLLESELFGFVKGAFTGAIANRRGRVALAEGGTLFLDEIGELPLPLQVKLLRLLQERTYEPVGSSESLVANFRLVAATNKDLLREVKAGRFRRDLYYRLNVCPVRLPALRERPGDIATLFSHFWTRRGEVRPLDADVITRFQRYAWPGNVRELENLAERLSVCAEGSVIRSEDLDGALVSEDDLELPPSNIDLAPAAARRHARGGEISEATLSAATPSAFGRVVAFETLATEAGLEADGTLAPNVSAGDPHGLRLPIDMPKLFRDMEEALIRTALAQSGGSRKDAAALLGIRRTTLVEKLRRGSFDTTGL